MVNNQHAAGLGVVVESGDRFLGDWGVLNNSQAENYVKFVCGNREPQDIRLCDTMGVASGKIQRISLYRIA
jgi:hypothetical protein